MDDDDVVFDDNLSHVPLIFLYKFAVLSTLLLETARPEKQ